MKMDGGGETVDADGKPNGEYSKMRHLDPASVKGGWADGVLKKEVIANDYGLASRFGRRCDRSS